VWLQDREALYFVDINKKMLCEYGGNDRHQVFALSSSTGSIAPSRSLQEGLILAQENLLTLFSFDSRKEEPILVLSEEPVGNRFNEGKCDAAGRFWVASMNIEESQSTGSLWSIGPDNLINRHLDGFIVGNGIGWSLDNRTMYFTDSHARKIYAFDFDLNSGQIGGRRCFAVVPESAGYPDGLTVDLDDHVWSAHWDGGCVTRYKPTGEIDMRIPLPVPRPTSIAFGGRELESLYITSAKQGLTADQLRRAPLSGSLFRLQFRDIRGLPPMAFAPTSTK
jgi:sugar lactone lactonase YvrE